MVRKKKRAPARASVRRRVSASRRSVSASRHARRRAVRVRGISRSAARRPRPRAKVQAAKAQSAAQQAASAQYVAAVKDFEAGLVLFQKQNYEKARQVFEKLAASAPLEVSSRARAYLKICEQKLGPAETVRGARDYYDLGIAHLNARNFDAALENLSKADKLAPRQEHIRYALAAVYALRGSAELALEHLAAAIQLRPSNRFQAARDQDLQSLAGDARFWQLIRSGVT